MDIKENTKLIEIKGRTFVLHKFDAWFGTYMAVQFLGSLLSSRGSDADRMSGLIKEITSKSPDELAHLQKQVLKYVSERLGSGQVSVVNEDGNLAIDNFTAMIAIKLMVEEVKFSMQDFFAEGDLLNDLPNGVQ